MNIKAKFKENKILAIGGILVLIFIIGYAIVKPPVAEDVFQKIKNYENDDIMAYLDEVYPEDGGFLGLFTEKNIENKGKVLSLCIEKINQDFENEYGRSISDYENVKITNVDIVSKDYSSDYVDINVTVNNGGETSVSYIKINLYYKNENEEVVKSEWTNDNSDIKPGASQVLTKMTKREGWKSVSAEIAEIR
ncbi:hypothetical protein [Inediibacterium massiliense]|uniref:hypothetical protein n=1 Tax=Inediibacterium massiliense TaxID=1658111 RepID=UPI0006B4CC6F|nr:hypothetical protein [Inediibacterium massiliense]